MGVVVSHAVHPSTEEAEARGPARLDTATEGEKDKGWRGSAVKSAAASSGAGSRLALTCWPTAAVTRSRGHKASLNSEGTRHTYGIQTHLHTKHSVKKKKNKGQDKVAVGKNENIDTVSL